MTRQDRGIIYDCRCDAIFTSFSRRIGAIAIFVRRGREFSFACRIRIHHGFAVRRITIFAVKAIFPRSVAAVAKLQSKKREFNFVNFRLMPLFITCIRKQTGGAPIVACAISYYELLEPPARPGMQRVPV